jgi:regulatory protein
MNEPTGKPVREGRRAGAGRPPRDLRERALGLLARREHSRVELARKLRPHAESAEALVALLDELEKRKLLSDARYAEARSHSLGRRFGSARIAHELRASGVASTLVDAAVRQARGADLERAREAWAKRFGRAPADALERAKQMRFLQGRGFGLDVIRKVIAGADDDLEG